MQGQQVAELNQLEQVLAAPDAIMEPNILEILKRYMKDGGNPATAVEMLCDGYAGTTNARRSMPSLLVQRLPDHTRAHAGYAQMASLVVEWTRELQDESGIAEQQEDADEAYFLRVRPALDEACTSSSFHAGHKK